MATGAASTAPPGSVLGKGNGSQKGGSIGRAAAPTRGIIVVALSKTTVPGDTATTRSGTSRAPRLASHLFAPGDTFLTAYWGTVVDSCKHNGLVRGQRPTFPRTRPFLCLPDAKCREQLGCGSGKQSQHPGKTLHVKPPQSVLVVMLDHPPPPLRRPWEFQGGR